MSPPQGLARSAPVFHPVLERERGWGTACRGRGSGPSRGPGFRSRGQRRGGVADPGGAVFGGAAVAEVDPRQSEAEGDQVRVGVGEGGDDGAALGVDNASGVASGEDAAGGPMAAMREPWTGTATGPESPDAGGSRRRVRDGAWRPSYLAQHRPLTVFQRIGASLGIRCLAAVAKITGAYIRPVRVRADDHALGEGTFARKQLFCRDRVIAWSHSSRFRMARRLVTAFRGRSLLDYGCGDGTFLACVSDLLPEAVGADLDPVEIARCSQRFAGSPCLSFKLIRDLEKERREGRTFDVVTCMEVLEHCTDESRERVLDDISQLVSHDGVVIVSVPVEIGPPLLIKETLRTVAGWRGLSDYRFKERYRLREILKMTFAGPGTVIERPIFPGSPVHHGHKGFNWLSLQQRLKDSFALQARHFSPLSWSRGWLSSQVWFVCTPR